MAIKPLAELADFDLVNSGQDCRGWTVMDAAGKRVGTVKEMLVDTDRELVTALVLDNGQQLPARDVSLKDGKVIVRGATTAQGKTTTTTTERTQTTPQTKQGDMAIPVIEEEIRIGKRQVETGGVRINQRVTERPVEETVTLREEQVNVERRPVDREVSSADAAAFKQGTIDVKTMSEEAVVSKGAHVVEEVKISKDVVSHDETIRDTVRRTDVDVEDLTTNKAKRVKR